MAAEPQQDNWEAKVDRMNESQMRSLEAIVGTSPEKVLEAAEGIKVISEETRKRIEAELGDLHIGLFKRALALEEKQAAGRPDKSKAAAFIRAFESVYGRFMLEQGSEIERNSDKTPKLDAEGNTVVVVGELEHKDSPLMKRLDKVLKFKVDAKLGLKGRAELQAVLRRLREVEAATKVGDDRAGEITALEAEKADKDSKLRDLQKKAAEIGAIGDLLEKIGNSKALSLNAAALRETVAWIKTLDDRSTALNDENSVKLPKDLADVKAEIKPYVDKIDNLRAALIDYRDAMDANSFDIEDRAGLDAAINKMAGVKIDSKADFVKWKAFLDGELGKVLKKVKQVKLNKIEALDTDRKDEATKANAAIAKVLDCKKAVAGDIGKLPKIFTGKLQALVDKLDGIEKKTQANLKELAKNVTDRATEMTELDTLTKSVVTGLEAVETEVNGLKTPANEALVPGLTAACDGYLAKFATFKGLPDADKPAAVEAIMKDYQTFVAELGTLLAKPRSDADTELMKAQEFLAGFDAEHKRLKSYKTPALRIQDIMDRAFGIQKTPEQMMELERKSAEAGHHVHEIADLHKYFSGEAVKDGEKEAPKNEVKDVQKRYEEIKGSTATAKEVRTKEAANAKTEKDKTKLGELKTLFGPDKSTALNDTFQQLEALEPAYTAAMAVPDLDTDLATKEERAKAIEKKLDSFRDPKAKYSDRAEIPNLETALENLNLVVLRAQKEKRDKFKDLAKKFRTDLINYYREYGEARKLGVALKYPSDAAKIEAAKNRIEGINVEKGFDFKALENDYDWLRSEFDIVLVSVNKKLEDPDFGVAKKQEMEDEKAKVEKAKALHASLKPIVEKMAKAGARGVLLKTGTVSGTETQEEADKKATEAYATEMEAKFKEIKPDHADFTVASVATFYATYLEQFVGSGDKRTALLTKIETGKAKAEKHQKAEDKELKLAKEAAEKSKDLTDVKAARKIVEVLVAENPEFKALSAADQAKIAKLVLAGDVGKLMTEKSYAEMAREGSAEVLDTVKQVGLRARLIGFRYKDGDKVVHPFDGLKPESFKDWPSIKNLFDIKKLNYKNGAFLLAALEIFDEERNANEEDKNKVVSIQTSGVEKKLKQLLAEQLGVKDRMDEAGVRKIVDEAFKAQMEKVRPLVRTHFENFGNNSKSHNEAMGYKVEALNQEHEELQYQLRTGKIDMQIFDMKVKKLLKSAEEAEVLDKINFSQNTVMSILWNNKYSQWVRDKGINVSKFIGAKTGLGLLGGGVVGGGRAMLGLAGKGVLRGGSFFGLGSVKLASGLALGIGSAFYRLFRGGTQGSYWKDVKADVSRVTAPISKAQDWAGSTSKSLKTGSYVPHHAKQFAAWTKYDGKKHDERDRVKKKASMRAERTKLLNEKAEMKILEVTESPFIDLAEFKARVEKLNKMVGEEDTKFPADTAKAGAEKKPEKEKSGESGDKPAEKKDDGAHPAPAAAHH